MSIITCANVRTYIPVAILILSAGLIRVILVTVLICHLSLPPSFIQAMNIEDIMTSCSGHAKRRRDVSREHGTVGLAKILASPGNTTRLLHAHRTIDYNNYQRISFARG